ncbi:hypothetical protein V8B97DRAFT_348743 [Scleroderma yunnanense]
MDSWQAAAAYADLLQAPFIGSFISLIFYGVSCVQTFVYFQTYPDDHRLLKWMVVVIWILESAHSGFAIAFNNSWLVGGYSDPVVLQHIVWEFVIWMLSKKLVYFLKYSTLVPAVLALVSTLMGFFDDTWSTFKNLHVMHSN